VLSVETGTLTVLPPICASTTPLTACGSLRLLPDTKNGADEDDEDKKDFDLLVPFSASDADTFWIGTKRTGCFYISGVGNLTFPTEGWHIAVRHDKLDGQDTTSNVVVGRLCPKKRRLQCWLSYLNAGTQARRTRMQRST
jgi:hypothetical protein